MECISKGKAKTPYEFGVKVSVATTLKEGIVVGMRSMPGMDELGSFLTNMKWNGRMENAAAPTGEAGAKVYI